MTTTKTKVTTFGQIAIGQPFIVVGDRRHAIYTKSTHRFDGLGSRNATRDLGNMTTDTRMIDDSTMVIVDA